MYLFHDSYIPIARDISRLRWYLQILYTGSHMYMKKMHAGYTERA